MPFQFGPPPPRARVLTDHQLATLLRDAQIERAQAKMRERGVDPDGPNSVRHNQTPIGDVPSFAQSRGSRYE